MKRMHIAILKRLYLGKILSGDKILECRLTKSNRSPYRQVQVGERVMLKESGGPIKGQGRVAKVEFFEELTPAQVQAIERKYNGEIQGSTEYWEQHLQSRYGSLIWLKEVKGLAKPYRIRTRGMRAWIVCDRDEFRKMRQSRRQRQKFLTP